ncbi:hypothetical protein R69919_04832 [Paraburkholderia gardini]|nr:hypothetical protein R69919_04832 [Paraburkholderia gardini]
MYAPVVTRFVTYDVKLDPDIVAYGQAILALPEMQEWIADAQKEVEEIDELDVEFQAESARWQAPTKLLARPRALCTRPSPHS